MWVLDNSEVVPKADIFPEKVMGQLRLAPPPPSVCTPLTERGYSARGDTAPGALRHLNVGIIWSYSASLKE